MHSVKKILLLLFPVLIAHTSPARNIFMTRDNPKNDSALFSSGVNIMGGGYYSVNDEILGYQVGGGLFFSWRKFQAEAQGFGKFRNDKADYQLAGLFGRKAEFSPKVFGVFSAGFGCELENMEISTPIYGNYGNIVGIKTSHMKGQYWGVKLQAEFFERTPGFTIGQFAGLFAGEDYMDAEFGIILALGK